jgi:hypothetical protein
VRCFIQGRLESTTIKLPALILLKCFDLGSSGTLFRLARFDRVSEK